MHLYKFRFPIGILIIVVIISGCATVRQVNDRTLIDIYAEQRKQPKKYPVVFIPGIMGSLLKDQKTNKLVWGKVSMGVPQLIALPINAPFQAVNLITGNDNLVPAGIVNKYSLLPGLVEIEIYDNARKIAMEAGGFTKDKDAFAFSYDWRKDLVDDAKQLGELIDRIKQQSNDPNLKVNIVCHSQGGLIARYYAKYGTADVLNEPSIPEPTYAGAKNINKIIMLGTPNAGSMESFHRIDQGLWLPFIGKITPETTFTMLSLYALLPYQNDRVFIDKEGTSLELNLYDPGNWEKYGWSIFNPVLQKHIYQKYLNRQRKHQGKLKYAEYLVNQKEFLGKALYRANRFHQALWQGDPNLEKQQVNYILFGSDCIPTLQRAIIKPSNTGYRTLYRDADRNMMKLLYGLGDGTVTKESLLGINTTLPTRMPTAYAIFISEKHGDLTQNPTFIDNILHVLLDQN
ncbi:MAG: lipase family alpha/beta hydrolase [bacterium]